MWYEAFTIPDLSFIIEYTKIRPYVYTHINSENPYTAFGVSLGHPIGPNADELLTRLTYNFNDFTRFIFDYRHIRKGENVYDDSGTLVRNVGGDIFANNDTISAGDNANFLDGNRLNYDNFKAGIRIEPVRSFIFELYYYYNITNELTFKRQSYQDYIQFLFTLEY